MDEKLEENINSENVSSFRKTEQIIEAAEHIERENQVFYINLKDYI